MNEQYAKKDDVIKIVQSLVDCDYDIHSAVCDACISIKSIPAADLVKVIKCKDCFFHNHIQNWCERLGTDMTSDDYCSYGEELK